MHKFLLIGLLSVFLLFPTTVWAQETGLTETISADSPPSDDPIIHIVEAGDSLYGIAVLYDTTVLDLLYLNNLGEDDVLQLGQQLIISGFVPSLPPGSQIIEDATLQNLPDRLPIPKFHTVQNGETLFTIAAQYTTTVEALLTANQLTEDSFLVVGDGLQIPNIPGDLIATNYVVQLGDTLAGISAEFNTTPAHLLYQTNLPNPDYLIVGQRLPVVSRTGTPYPVPLNGRPHSVQPGDSLITIAAQHNVTPQTLAAANGLTFPAPVYNGQILRVPGDGVYGAFSAEFSTITLSQPPKQGETFTLYIETTAPFSATGKIKFSDFVTPTRPYYRQNYEQTFRFSPFGNGAVAVVGIDAFVQPGLYTLQLFKDDNPTATFIQPIKLAPLDYGFQQIPIPDQPGIRAMEDQILTAIYTTYTPEPRWQITGTFSAPLDDSYRSAAYGAARSYAGAPVRIFHSGVDFGAPLNTPIRAVAAGTVVYSDFTELRGNIVILDHGLGVMTGYFHMETRAVAVGEQVSERQTVGSLGNTGLSTAAHLHWDVRINNVPVNGLQWLNTPLLLINGADQ